MRVHWKKFSFSLLKDQISRLMSDTDKSLFSNNIIIFIVPTQTRTTIIIIYTRTIHNFINLTVISQEKRIYGIHHAELMRHE